MILYLDTSALLKLYVNEPGAVEFRRLFSRCRLAATHQIAYAEVLAGVGKARRMGRITPAQLAELLEDIENDWSALEVIGVDSGLVRHAGRLALDYGLRGFDSIHLAAAELFFRTAAEGVAVRFAVFDRTLADAARHRGIPLLDT